MATIEHPEKQILPLQEAFDVLQARVINAEQIMMLQFELNALSLNLLAVANNDQKQIVIDGLREAAGRAKTEITRKMAESLADAITHGGPHPSWEPH